jgi:hypothetical protein
VLNYFEQVVNFDKKAFINPGVVEIITGLADNILKGLTMFFTRLNKMAGTKVMFT